MSYGTKVKRKRAYLWPSAANLTHIAVVYLWWFWWLFGFERFVLEGCFLGESASSPGSSGCRSSDGLLLLLLLLLLLVVRGCCRVHSGLIAWIWRAWKKIQGSTNQNVLQWGWAHYNVNNTNVSSSKLGFLPEYVTALVLYVGLWE